MFTDSKTPFEHCSGNSTHFAVITLSLLAPHTSTQKHLKASHQGNGFETGGEKKGSCFPQNCKRVKIVLEEVRDRSFHRVKCFTEYIFVK